MQKWYQIIHKNTGLSLYIWGVFYILPFYFIFKASSPYQMISGITMVILFFVCYVLAFVSKGWQVYFWTAVQIIITIAMTLLFGYVYFSIFLAFFIGNIQNKIGFFTLYTIHLVAITLAINYGLVTRNPILISQLPFVLLNLIGVILLPISTYNRNKREKLLGQLEDANKRISELVKLEERQRIARDLHDTLGQKLALIGLKSDLAGKLMTKDIQQAQAEMNDVHQTARTALNEVREMVTQMRGTRVEDELYRIQQILKAAHIELVLEGDYKMENTSLLNENVISMCLKEAVTNVVKHSDSTQCTISFEPSRTDLFIRVQDNGIGLSEQGGHTLGNGLRGMKERLEFVNGSLEMTSNNGTILTIRVPNTTIRSGEEAIQA